MRNRFTAIVISAALLSACTGGVQCFDSLIYPDYTDVMVPCNIAPLNFHYTGSGYGRCRTTFTVGDLKLEFRGREVNWEESQWKQMLSQAVGDTIRVSNSKGDAWTIAVSADSIDSYLTYRLIEPAYEVWHEVEIVERCIENFDETVLCDHKHTGNSCMNCHIHGQNRGDYSLFYLRGPKGAAILNRNGKLSRYNLKAEGMVSSTVYGELHPSGRYGVFSSNIIIPGFHSNPAGRLEVYDRQSDLAVADFDDNQMHISAQFSRADKLETFPCFSADGRWVYYCSADTVALPEDITRLRYSLYRAGFDEKDGYLKGEPEVVWDASVRGGSVCHPKCSPDGKWILYTVADYGTFPIWHTECDLELMELSSGRTLSLENVNSDRSDTYHSWSSNSRWVVFASKRGDGQYGRPYFFHLDGDGNATKPFVLPQKAPDFYEKYLLSFNIPDLGRTSVGFTCEDTATY